MSMRTASRSISVTVFVALLGLALLVAPAVASEECPDHPCKGWTYQIIYRISDGVIVAWSGFNGGHDNLPPGTAAINVTNDSRLMDLRTLPKYYVELSNRQIREKPGYVAPAETPASDVSPTEAGMGLALPLVGGIVGVASLITGRRLVRRRGAGLTR